MKKVSVKINLKKVIVPKFGHYYFFPFSHRYYFEICVKSGKKFGLFRLFLVFYTFFFGFFMLFWTFFDLGIHLKHLQLHSSIYNTRMQFYTNFSGPEPAGVKKAFVYIRMNSSTDSSGSNESGQNRRSTVSCRTKRDFFRFVSTFFCGFLYFFRFEHLQCSNAILCNFSDPEVSWYEEGIGMNSSTGRVAAMKAAETADQQHTCTNTPRKFRLVAGEKNDLFFFLVNFWKKS